MGVNHVLNNLVEAFLKAHPERDRDPEEKAEMDKSNKVTDKLVRSTRTSPCVLCLLARPDECAPSQVQ